MVKNAVCAAILAILCCSTYADNMDCVRFLRAGDQKICLRTVQETQPALAVKIDNSTYYANTMPGRHNGIMFKYNGTTYSLYNRENTEYELIHWLSGTDELVDGVWRDRMTGITSDTGPLDFENHGCVWNDEHTGYYSADGLAQYFQTADIPVLDFGTDWYVEVTATVGEPIGTECVLIDLASLAGVKYGTGIAIDNHSESGRLIGRIYANNKINSASVAPNTNNDTYTWDQKSVFTTGETQYTPNQSRAFITWNGNQYYSAAYDTISWNTWQGIFYLFRGIATTWTDDAGFRNVYECGPTTIYDIKVWRKK